MKNIFNVKRNMLILFLTLFTYLIIPQILSSLLTKIYILNNYYDFNLFGIKIFELKRVVYSSGLNFTQVNFNNWIYVLISLIYVFVFYLNDLRFKK